MRSYKDLEIYQLSYDLAVKVHRFTFKLPKYELYEEGSHARKASKGITSASLRDMVEEGIKLTS